MLGGLGGLGQNCSAPHQKMRTDFISTPVLGGVHVDLPLDPDPFPALFRYGAADSASQIRRARCSEQGRRARPTGRSRHAAFGIRLVHAHPLSSIPVHQSQLRRRSGCRCRQYGGCSRVALLLRDILRGFAIVRALDTWVGAVAEQRLRALGPVLAGCNTARYTSGRGGGRYASSTG
jgi:hypothetical protein